MSTSMIFGTILAFYLLTTFAIHVSTLPITSKPIEGTAEHLAWQAWLMLPPEQKNLEKSRKVTPKSIFTLPFRECPPGHHLFENRCIPTVNIDPIDSLAQDILGIYVGDNNTEFDYDYVVSDEITDAMYEQPQNLSGDDYSKDIYHYDQSPIENEPLKVNIFQQKFPTDYESDSISNDEPEEQAAKSTAAKVNAATPLAEAVNAFTVNDSSLNATQTNNSNVVDLQMESSNISMNIAQKTQNTSSNNSANSSSDSDDIVTPAKAFSLIDIDAIVLAVLPTHNSNLESTEQNEHKFSLFKDDNSVQLVTSKLLADHDNEHEKQPDLSQLLRADNLLPLPNITANSVTSSIENNDSSTVITATTPHTRISSIFRENEVSTLSTLFASSIDTTTSQSGDSEDDAVEATHMTPSDTESTIPTLLVDYLKHIEKVDRDEDTEHNHAKKEEHPRSVPTQNVTSALMEPQEEKFTTTTEPDTTTNFQVDETTVDEIHDAPTIALKELLELAQHPSSEMRENLGTVVKKSKVEPVELPPIELIEAETDSSVIKASTRPTIPTSTSPTNSVDIKTAEVSTSSTQLPTASTSSSTKTDRFDNQQLDISSTIYRNQPDERQRNANSNDEQHNDNNFRNTETAKPTTQTSEIDNKQELRMINELVKGSSKSKQQFKGGIIKSVTTSTAESGISTVVKKSTKSTAVSNKDKISGTSEQHSITNEEESRTSAATTSPTLMTTPTETTTVATTATTATTNESTATIWSKIMPLLGLSTSFGETTKTTPSKLAISSTTASSDITSVSSSINIESSTGINNNRSNRNSKIIRISNLSTPSYSSSSSSNNNNILSNELLVSTTESSTTINEMNDSSTTTSSSPSAETDAFWWLPSGWRLDRTTNNDGVSEPSLLLRFWSAFPNGEDTSKLNK